MTYTFYPELAWDNNESYQEMNEFEASSVEEALKEIHKIINGDTEAEYAEDFYLTARDGEKDVWEFEYRTKLRESTILYEADTLFGILKIQLKELFK